MSARSAHQGSKKIVINSILAALYYLEAKTEDSVDF